MALCEPTSTSYESKQVPCGPITVSKETNMTLREPTLVYCEAKQASVETKKVQCEPITISKKTNTLRKSTAASRKARDDSL